MYNYNERTYRNLPQGDRWQHFIIKYKEIDIWIAVSRNEFREEMATYCQTLIEQQRNLLDRYLAKDSGYAKALTPYKTASTAPAMLKAMERIGFCTGIGPMSAVAGAFAEFVGRNLQQRFNVSELVVENGGDIYMILRDAIDVAVYAGTSPLSNRIGFSIPAELTPLGVCTSAGTIGPSLSFGSADAVMIVCKDVLLADSYATRFANSIHTKEDLEPVMNEIKKINSILAAIVIKADNMAVTGNFDLKLFN